MPAKKSTASKMVKKCKDEEIFTRDDCDEKDFKDTGARKRRNKKGNKEDNRAKIISDEFMPSSTKKLRACINCKLVLNRQRWVELGKCPNCPSSGGLSETTDEFQNVIGQIYPKMSWVAHYQGIDQLIPGIYAMSISQNASSREDDLDDEDLDY